MEPVPLAAPGRRCPPGPPGCRDPLSPPRRIPGRPRTRCKRPGRGARQRSGFASAAPALGSACVSRGSATASPGDGSQLLPGAAVALSHTNRGQGGRAAPVPHLPSGARESSPQSGGWARGSAAGWGLRVGGQAGTPGGCVTAGEPLGNCKAGGAQTRGRPLRGWMRFGVQLRTRKLSASLGKPRSRSPAGSEGSWKDSGCHTLSPLTETSFKTLCGALTPHLPPAPAGTRQRSAREQKDAV